MTRNQLRTFIQAGADALKPSVFFGSGRITSLNSLKSDNEGQPFNYPFVWLVSPGTTEDLTVNNKVFDNWNVQLHIGLQDAVDSNFEQYEALIDEADMIARKLVSNYNTVISGYDTITMTGLSIQPFIKSHSHCTTGVILSFTLNAPQNVDLC